jgi:hypothetical protein
VDIFFGVVYYQRLRHMVNDKYQVRSTGTREMLMRQPIGGRKKGGGIRFGEVCHDEMSVEIFRLSPCLSFFRRCFFGKISFSKTSFRFDASL